MVSSDKQKIEEIMSRGVHEIVTKDDLRERLESGKQLHLKLGTDVTGPLLHLGHSVVHRKIRDFQELGHKVTLIIGDFTTLVGDHSDKVDMRTDTSPEEIKKNEESYKEQFFKTVIEDQTEIRHNSEWLGELKLDEVIFLEKQFTIAQMLDRETFKLRFEQNKPIGLDEFLYPLMQGYDSVILDDDVEFGGTDQTFNLLAGRKLMEVYGKKPQAAFITKLLTGSDGRPMGKSLKNFIPIADAAEDMYGKVMSIVDEIIFEYFELVTRVPMEDIYEMEAAVQSGDNPMKYKKMLAKEIVTFYHSEKEAQKAEEYFEKTVQRGEVPEGKNIEISIEAALKINAEVISPADSMKTSMLNLLKTNLDGVSSGEIKRMISQGGVELNGEKIADFNQEVEFKKGDIIKFGKRSFIEIK